MIIIPIPDEIRNYKNCIIKSILKKQMKKHKINSDVEIDDGVIYFDKGKQNNILEAMKINNIWC
jgi:hypothetical protein